MQMRTKAVSAGFRTPTRTKLGINLYTQIVIEFRHTPNAKPFFAYCIDKALSPATKTGTSIFAWVATTWFNVDTKKWTYFANATQLGGKTVDLTIYNGSFGGSTFDILIKTVTEDDNSIILKKFGIKTDPDSLINFQLGDTEIRGVLRTAQVE